MECENPNHFGTYIDSRNVLRCSAKDCWIKQLPPKHVRDQLEKEARARQEEMEIELCLDHQRQVQKEFPEQAAADEESAS